MAPPSRRHARAALAGLWFAFLLNQADRQALASVLPLVRDHFGWSPARLGLLLSSFQWVYALVVPAAGWISDTFDRRRVVVAAVVGWSVATASSGIAGGFAALLVLRAATGAGEACYFPAATSLIVDWHGKERSGWTISLHQSAVYFGIVLAGVAAGWMGERFGWRSPFLAFGLVGLAYGLVLAWKLPPGARPAVKTPPKAAGAPPGRFLAVLAIPSFRWLVLAYIGMLLVNTAYLAWTPTLLHDRFGLSLASAGFHAAVFHQAGALCGILAGGRISDRWAARSPLARPLIQLGGLACGAPFILALGRAESASAMYAALGLFGFCRGFFDSNLFPSLFAVVPQAVRGVATGLMLALAFAGGGFGPWLVGILAGSLGMSRALGWSGTGYVAGAVCLGVACATSFTRDHRRAAEEMACPPAAALPSS